MHRREFLTLAGLLGLGTSLPPLLAPFGLLGDDQGGPAPDDVAAALAEARLAGKPLLVFVVPGDQKRLASSDPFGLDQDLSPQEIAVRQAIFERGEAFGAWLQHGRSGELADLALCTVVCATMGQLSAHVSGVDVARQPWMVLVETDEAAPTPVYIDGELPSDAQLMDLEFNDLTWKQREQRAIEAVRQRIDALHLMLREGLSSSRTLSTRAQQTLALLAPPEAEALLAPDLDAAQLPLDVVERGAAVLLWRAAQGAQEEQAAADELLTRAVIERLRVKPPPGAYWASSWGCGVTVENDPRESSNAWGCGMGHVPEISRRFLYLFTLK